MCDEYSDSAVSSLGSFDRRFCVKAIHKVIDPKLGASAQAWRFGDAAPRTLKKIPN